MWEKTHDYRDIERYYTHCDAEKCSCPNGTTFSNKKWNIQRCSCCGSYALHKLCRPETERENIIICYTCLNVVQPSQHTNDAQVHTNESQIINRHITSSADRPGPEQNVLQNSNRSAKVPDDIVIDLTGDDDQINIFDINIHSVESVPETLEEKRNREKAERPIRNEMRDFRISLWFRDYKCRRSNKSQ